ncbi:MAG: UPF0149 family protein [Gammaproteobacteria bacterium]|nr:UPF0149 family protein [Gammaproteobacteria bacterium]
MLGQRVELEEIERRLAGADVEMSGAEVHGLFSGLLCSARPDTDALWLTELFPDPVEGDLLREDCLKSLRRLFDQTRIELNDSELGFSLLLPDDEQPLKRRAAGIVDWCQGFLYGIGIAGVSTQTVLSPQAQEALRDISEVTRMDLDGLEDYQEDGEDALMQITEFLWVAAMLVHDELVQSGRARL